MIVVHQWENIENIHLEVLIEIYRVVYLELFINSIMTHYAIKLVIFMLSHTRNIIKIKL